MGRYSVAHQRILKAGFTNQQMTDAVVGELKPGIESTEWAVLSRSQRKREWLRLCLIVVKRAERLLVELKSERRIEEEEALGFTNTTRLQRSLSPSPPRTSMSKKVRKIKVGPPSADSRIRRRKQLSFRVRRLRISAAVQQKHLAVRAIEQPIFRFRRLSIDDAVGKRRLATRLAAITERTQQHTERQRLRSQRRMKLLCTRMEWHRQYQEKTVAGDDLWGQAQEAQHSSPQQEDVWAWPRLAQRQRDLLANEVQAFVRGGAR